MKQLDQPTLYVIGLSIGNIKDISPHSLELLKCLKILACEDTRKAIRILNELGISDKKKFISIYEHNERIKTPGVIEILKQGQDVGLVVSRGMPAVSDPGYILVRNAIQEGIKIKVSSGPSAFLNALLLSGLPTDKFIFLGFPPRKPGKQIHFFEKYKDLDVTLLFYESPRRLFKTLKNLEPLFSNWHLALCRELTKTHEEILRGTFSEVLKDLEGAKILGEYVVVLSEKK